MPKGSLKTSSKNDLPSNPRPELKETLDSLYGSFDFASRARHDPIRFPMMYEKKEDIEASAFIASSFAYGRVEAFSGFIEGLLSAMGESPHDFLLGFRPGQGRRNLLGGYRFSSTEDVLSFLAALGALLKRDGSIERAFMSFYGHDDPHTENALRGFLGRLRGLAPLKSQGLFHLIPSPEGGSAFKRANLFLRWMVRDADVDFGLWRGIPKSRLIIPLDTHIAKAAMRLGLTGRKSNDLKTAVEITDALKTIDPEDPLKYDFPLCHAGMLKALIEYEDVPS